MHINVSDEQEAFHNLINLRLYPQVMLRLGQTEESRISEARIITERTGSPYQWGPQSVTYSYHIDGQGFELWLRAVYPEHDCATAAVEVISITPSDGEAREACLEWVNDIVSTKKPPRDLFADMALQ